MAENVMSYSRFRKLMYFAGQVTEHARTTTDPHTASVPLVDVKNLAAVVTSLRGVPELAAHFQDESDTPAVSRFEGLEPIQ